MEAYTNMKIEMENKEAAKAAMEIMKAEVEQFREDYPFGTEEFLKDLKVKNANVILDCCLLDPWTFEEMMPTLFKIIANNDPDQNFTVRAWSETTSNYLVDLNATFENGNLTINKMVAAEGDGFCPNEDCDECGRTIVFADEYEEGKTYICPYCGREYTAEEVFVEIPYFEKETIKIK